MDNIILVSEVLDASYSCAPDMTHALCSLGGGDMGSGIIALWEAGQRIGMIKGTAITTLVFSAGIACVVIIRHRHKARLQKAESKEVSENA